MAANQKRNSCTDEEGNGGGEGAQLTRPDVKIVTGPYVFSVLGSNYILRFRSEIRGERETI